MTTKNIYKCEKCAGTLKEEDMGNRCHHCGAWTYTFKCLQKGR